MALVFIDRTPPIYEGGDFNKNTTEQELRRCIAHMNEMSNYMAYLREMNNYNLNQLGAVPSGEEGNNG